MSAPLPPPPVAPTLGDATLCPCGKPKRIVAIEEKTHDGERIRRVEWLCDGPCGKLSSTWARID